MSPMSRQLCLSILSLALMLTQSGCGTMMGEAAKQGFLNYANSPTYYSTYTSRTRIGKRTYSSITTCHSSTYGGGCYTSTR